MKNIRKNRLNNSEVGLESRNMLSGQAISRPQANPELGATDAAAGDIDNSEAGVSVIDTESRQRVDAGSGQLLAVGKGAATNEAIRNDDNGSIPLSTLEARDANGTLLTGEGASIGIISDSFNVLGGLERDIESGDLPEDIRILEDRSSGTDEGRGIAQVIADIAPNADLTFQTWDAAANANSIPLTEDQQSVSDIFNNNGDSVSTSDLRLGRAYQNLIEDGVVDIIVDDVASPVAPVYQLGFEALAQEQAVAEGISVFTSAGNFGDDSVEVEFSGEEGDFVDFDPDTDGIQGLPVSYGPTTTLDPKVTLFWDDPYQSINNDSELTADFDLLFLGNDSVIDNENPENNVLTSPLLRSDQEEGVPAGSSKVQLDELGAETGADPYEFYNSQVDSLAPGESVQGQWFAQLKRGSGDDRLVRVQFTDNNAPELANDATIWAAGASANSVGSVNALTNQLQPFSARGGSRILFDSNGDRLETPVTSNVSFLAPDNFNTTFFGGIDTDGDGNPNFRGTSAAAPAAAAVGALLLEVDPSLSPGEISDTLAATTDARDEGDFGGLGLINAQAAVDEWENFLSQPGVKEERAAAFRQQLALEQRAAGDSRRGSDENRPGPALIIEGTRDDGTPIRIAERTDEGNTRRIDRIIGASDSETAGDQRRSERSGANDENPIA